jgi:hypothetical protein
VVLLIRPRITVVALALAAWGCTAGCGTRTALGTDAHVGDGATGFLDGGDGSQACTASAPQSHRTSGLVCPQQRGPGVSGLAPPCSPDAGVPTNCWQDSDCTAGTNGRCLPSPGPMACMSGCSYDSCSSDSDCPTNIPCDCRAQLSGRPDSSRGSHPSPWCDQRHPV